MKDGGKVTVADYSGGVSFSTGKYEGKRFTMRPDANTSYWDDKIFEKCRDDGHVKLKLSGTVEGKSASGSTYAECTPQSQWKKVDCDDIAADAAAPSATPVDTPAPSVTAAPTGSSAIAACDWAHTSKHKCATTLGASVEVDDLDACYDLFFSSGNADSRSVAYNDDDGLCRLCEGADDASANDWDFYACVVTACDGGAAPNAAGTGCEVSPPPSPLPSPAPTAM